MQAKSTFFLLFFVTLFLAGCEAAASEISTEAPKVDIINDQFPEAQAEIQAVLDGIFKSIQDKDADGLIAYHLYSPKFTEFQNSAPRTGSKENEAGERGLVAAISAFDYELRDLKINVFGDVAVITFNADFRPTIDGVTSEVNNQVTLVFVRADDTWKITHEHISPLVS